MTFRLPASPQRFWAALVSALLVATGLFVVAAAPASAATRNFTPIFSTNTTGDVMIRGNSLMTCPTGSFSAGSGTLSCANVQNGTSNGVNNNFKMGYVDTDSDTNTFDSSDATVTIPAGATVLYAGLSWSGTSGAGSLAGYSALTGVAAPNASIRNQVKFKVPGGTSYTGLTSTAAVDSTGSGYQGFKDVTSAVAAAGSGVYTVADVQAGTGGNDYAGWALAVAYRDPTQPIRNLVIYTGFTNVANGASTSIPISGFTTPLTGPVVTRMGAVVYEGDRGNIGDTMTLGSTAISNALNPVTDVENNSISDLGVPITDRTPAYPNTLSVDIDRFDATGFLTNGQTSTTFNLKTVGDGYYPGLISLATNLYSPSLQVTKTVKDLTNGITGTVKPGDALAYSMAIKNVGGDGSTSSILTDAVPAGSTYVPGSLVIAGTPVTDASGDDAGNVAGGTVTARLGAGATAAVGGAVATNASTTVAFNVTVNAGDANGTVIANAAALGYNSATTGTSFIGASNTVSSTVSVINVNPVLAFAAPPSGEVNATYTNTLTAAGGTGPYSWTVTTGALPAGLTLNPATGVISGTPTASGFSNFTVSATDANAQVATQATSIYVAPQPTLTYPTALQNGDTGAAYSYPLGVNPGTGPYVWSVSVGSLPAGLTLDPATGVISGTPTTAVANKTFTVKVVDAFGASATEVTTLTVIAGPTLSFAAPPNGEVSAPYSDDLDVVGGAGPYIWTITAGTLPAGVTLDSASGLLSGTPTAAGTSNFTVTVTDVNGAAASETTSITVIAAPAVAFTPPPGEVGVAYTAQPTASGGTSPYTWTVSAGTLPAGLAIDPGTGAITGTPTAASAASVTIRATDAVGGTATQARTITIVLAPTLTGTLPAGQLSVPYSSGFTVNDGIGPFVWSISSGTLPAGLSISTSTGLITGTATATGSFPITVLVTDAKNSTTSRSGTITVTANPAVTFTPPTGEVGIAYTAQPTAAGGTAPYTWAVSGGTLPAGLSLNTTTGAITGTPTTAVVGASVTVRVTDAVGRTASQARTITIVATPTLTGTLAAGELTAPYNSGFTVNDGIGPFVWSISSGSLPAGLSISTSTGLITGTATATGSFPITVLVTDAKNSTTTRSGTIVVIAGPAVTFPPPNGEVGAAYTAQPTASGGTSPYTWAVSAGTLPAGLSINTGTGAITGTPTTVGAASVTVQATDSKGGTATQAGTITIVATPTLTGTLAAGELTAPYSSGFTVNDGIGPFTWSIDISSGTLPGGLTINASTGLITGTPTDAGSFPITVGVTDVNNFTTTRTGTLTVTAGPAVTFAPPNGEVGVGYTAQPTVAGGTGPYTWAVSVGTLPGGLSINATTGAITGIPTAAGTTNITVQATDSIGGTTTQAGTIAIVAATTLTFTAPPAAELGANYSDQLTKSGGVGPFTWTISTGSLPTGVTLASDTGLLSGTPTALGTFNFTVRIVDVNNKADTKTATIDVNKTTSTVSVSAPASARFGKTITITATVAPSSAGGTVTFTDVANTGPQAGNPVTLGTGTVSGGAASLTTALPAFGVNTVKATYGGDATHATATSTTTSVEVSAYAGEVIVTEFRTSGPGGAGDNYVELLNTGPTVPLAGFKISADSGTVTTLPANAGLLGTGRSYLLTGAGFTLAAIATSDDVVATVGTGGMKVTAPDTGSTRTDAVGPATGFHTGTGLLPITGDPDSNWAWVRTELAGAAVDSRNNAADFQLVSTGLAPVGGVQPTLGSPSPTGTADPYQHNATLRSTLLDPGKGAGIAPNRVVVTGTPGQLVIRRTITNTTGQTITAAKVRVSALSEQFGAPEPGVANQPTGIAQLHAINPATPTEQVTVTGGASVTVHDLSVDSPSAGPGGGLNSTFTVTLPGGGLAPGASINVAFTFAIETHGTFWFGYDVDATTTAVAPGARPANRAAAHSAGRTDAGQSTTRHTAATVTGYLR